MALYKYVYDYDYYGLHKTASACDRRTDRRTDRIVISIYRALYSAIKIGQTNKNSQNEKVRRVNNADCRNFVDARLRLLEFYLLNS